MVLFHLSLEKQKTPISITRIFANLIVCQYKHNYQERDCTNPILPSLKIVINPDSTWQCNQSTPASGIIPEPPFSSTPDSQTHQVSTVHPNPSIKKPYTILHLFIFVTSVLKHWWSLINSMFFRRCIAPCTPHTHKQPTHTQSQKFTQRNIHTYKTDIHIQSKYTHMRMQDRDNNNN